MEGRTLLASDSPITQSIDAVKALLAYAGRASDPLPTFVEMPSREVVLVLSGKKDVYYTTTPRSCSCPSGTYRPGQVCKHRRNYFSPKADKLAEAKAKTEESRRQAREYQARQRALKASANPADNSSIKPKGKWPGGFNGPADPDQIKAESPKSSILQDMLIDCGHDTNMRDVAYWEKKQSQEV
jgi:hypothetical protein